MPLPQAAFPASPTQLLKMYGNSPSRVETIASTDNVSQIHIYDEGAQNGSTIPYIQNYKQLNESISASVYGGGGVTNVTYDVVFTFHTCDRIALRWQENAVTTADVGYGR